MNILRISDEKPGFESKHMPYMIENRDMNTYMPNTDIRTMFWVLELASYCGARQILSDPYTELPVTTAAIPIDPIR